jgi:O-acetyl-ADP-ribose deacetylase (regulator of RNase III)
VAFPAISTGVYGFPKGLAARIAIGEVRGHLASTPHPSSVWLVSFRPEDQVHLRQELAAPGA